MYLEKWEPVFKRERGAMHGDVSLRFKAKLRCPSCKTLNDVITSGHVINSTDFNRITKSKINELAQLRGCVKCGVASTFPQDDFERLVSEAKLQITATRVKKESDRLYGRKVVV